MPHCPTAADDPLVLRIRDPRGWGVDGRGFIIRLCVREVSITPLASLATVLQLRTTAPVQAVLAGVLGFVLAGAAAVTAWHLSSLQSQGERARFGETMSRQVALLAAEPVLQQDSIGLGTLANRMAAFDEVRSITIHSVDDRLLAAAGDTGIGEGGQAWVGPITVEETVAGHVRVVLEPSRFQPSLTDAVAVSWPAWLAAFLLTVPICYLLAREGKQRQAPPIGSFLLVVNLFNRTVLSYERRAAVLDEGLKIAERVVGLYGGRALEHAEAGILLAFDDSGQPDRAFEAVCGALLTQGLFEAMRRRAGGGREAPIFRYGLSVAPWYAGAEELAEAAQTRDAILLSALAPSGELAIGNAAHRAIERPDRLELAPLDTVATQTLSVTLAPCRIVRGAAGAYRTVLDEQVKATQRPVPA